MMLRRMACQLFRLRRGELKRENILGQIFVFSFFRWNIFLLWSDLRQAHLRLLPRISDRKRCSHTHANKWTWAVQNVMHMDISFQEASLWQFVILMVNIIQNLLIRAPSGKETADKWAEPGVKVWRGDSCSSSFVLRAVSCLVSRISSRLHTRGDI